MKKNQKIDLKSKSNLEKLMFSHDHKWKFYTGEDEEFLSYEEEEEEEKGSNKLVFEKLFSLTFLILDDLWYENNANYMQFPTILELTSSKLQSILIDIDSLTQIENLLEKYIKK